MSLTREELEAMWREAKYLERRILRSRALDSDRQFIAIDYIKKKIESVIGQQE